MARGKQLVYFCLNRNFLYVYSNISDCEYFENTLFFIIILNDEQQKNFATAHRSLYLFETMGLLPFCWQQDPKKQQEKWRKTNKKVVIKLMVSLTLKIYFQRIVAVFISWNDASKATTISTSGDISVCI